MTAQADIKTDKRSVLTYLLKPIVKTLDNSFGKKGIATRLLDTIQLQKMTNKRGVLSNKRYPEEFKIKALSTSRKVATVSAK